VEIVDWNRKCYPKLALFLTARQGTKQPAWKQQFGSILVSNQRLSVKPSKLKKYMFALTRLSR